MRNNEQLIDVPDEYGETMSISIAELMVGTNRLSPYNYNGAADPHLEPYTFYSVACNNAYTYYVYDHLGNTRITYTPTVTNNAMSYHLNGVFDYYPYAKILREYIDGQQEIYLSTHHERDVETGLDYRGARFYDCDIARFLSLDPLAEKYPMLSPYMFVGGNPLLYVDPDGKAIKPVNKDAATLINATIEKYGGDNFKAIIGFENNKGIMHAVTTDAKVDQPLSKKYFKRELKAKDINLNNADINAAYNLYTSLWTPTITELSVIIKGTEAATIRYSDNEEGSKLNRDAPGISTNRAYGAFLNEFERGNSTLDLITNGNGYGTIPYAPIDKRNPELHHQGTLVVDATKDRNARGTVPTLEEALKPK